MDPQFPFKTEKLSKDEVRLLRKRMLSTWVFGAVIGAFAGYFLFGDFGHFEGMRIPVTIFAVFFYLILGFILFVHTRNAFQTEKRIYSGRITDKKTEASRMRDSQMNEEYYIALEENWFRVELQQFQKVHVNDQVEIFTLGKTQVFKIERRGEASPEFVHEKTQTQKQTDLYSGFSNFSEVLGENDRSVLKSALRKAFFYRTILGFFGCYCCITS